MAGEVKEVIETMRTRARAVRVRGEDLTVDIIENIMLHLEASDESFHRYALVKSARGQLEELVAQFMDGDFESVCAREGEHEAVYQTVEKIITSPMYSQFKRGFLENLQHSLSIASLDPPIEVRTTEEEFLDGFDESDEDETELDDDLGESFFGLLPPGNELRRMVKSLGVQQAMETRLEALRGLTRLSPADLIASEHWGQIKTHLRTALLDHNERIFREALIFHLKLMNTGILSVMKEIFLHFAAHMLSMTKAGLLVPVGSDKGASADILFTAHDGRASPMAGGGLNMDDAATRRIMQQVFVFDSMKNSLPRFWQRFGERGMVEIVEAAMSLYFAPDGSSCILTRYSALSDPRALWFSKWMSGNFSRSHMLNYFRHHSSALRCVLRFLPVFQQATSLAAERPRTAVPAGCVHEGEGEHYTYSQAQLDYVCAMHNVCVVAELLLYTRGRALFPCHLEIENNAHQGLGNSEEITGEAGREVVSLAHREESEKSASSDRDYATFLSNNRSDTYLRESQMPQSRPGTQQHQHQHQHQQQQQQQQQQPQQPPPPSQRFQSFQCYPQQATPSALHQQQSLLEPSSVITVDSILLMLAEISCSSTRTCSSEDKSFFIPSVVAADLLKRLVSYVQPSQHLLLNHAVLSILAKQIWTCAREFQQGVGLASLPGSSELLLDIADILGLLAMSVSGRQLLLGRRNEGSNTNYNENKDHPCNHVPLLTALVDNIPPVISEQKHMYSHQSPPLCVSVVELVIKLLTCITEQGACTDMFLDIARAYLFVCRQLYNTHEGLWALYPLMLHDYIAKARSAATLNPALGELLTDSLLNFAWTPRGLSLLASLPSPHLHACVARMFDRFHAKMQVSKYEKFGYGVMVAELSTSTVGMRALETTGFIEFAISTLVHALETYVDYKAPGEPSSGKGLRKVFNYAALVLTSWAAVSTLGEKPAHQQQHESHRESYKLEPGKSISHQSQDIIDKCTTNSLAHFLRFLLSDDEGPFAIASEAADNIRLRILNILCACLDNFLVMETNFELIAKLLQWQRQSCIPADSGQPIPIIDPCSLLRNRILVAAQVSGGPNERLLPPVGLDDEGGMALPLVIDSTIPSVYILEAAPSQMDLSLLSKPPTAGQLNSREAGIDWAREALHNILCIQVAHHRLFRLAWTSYLKELLHIAFLSYKPSSDAPVLIENSTGKNVNDLDSSVSTKLNIHVPDPPAASMAESGTAVAVSSTATSLPSIRPVKMNSLGADIVTRYALQLGYIQNTEAAAPFRQGLLTVIAEAQRIIHVNTSDAPPPSRDNFFSAVAIPTNSSPPLPVSREIDPATFLSWTESPYGNFGFDWFAATVYLLCHGDVASTLSLLQSCATQSTSLSVWPQRGRHLQVQYRLIAHWIGHIVQAELPLVAGALCLSGITVARVCVQWLQQCFWNILDWVHISAFVTSAMLEGPDYPIFFCAALFRHLQADILVCAQQQRLFEFLQTSCFDFNFPSHFPFISDLRAKYRTAIFSDLDGLLR